VGRSAIKLGIGVAGIGAFVVAAAAAVDREPAVWELEITRWFHDGADWWAIVLWPVMALGSTPGAIAVAAIVWWALGRRAGVVVGASFATAYLAANLLKRIVGRDRPDTLDLGVQPRDTLDSLAFPSGHSTQAFAVAVAVALVAGPWGGWRFALLPLAAVTAMARMYFGVHFVGDVLAGAVLGTSIALLVDRVVPTEPDIATRAGASGPT